MRSALAVCKTLAIRIAAPELSKPRSSAPRRLRRTAPQRRRRRRTPPHAITATDAQKTATRETTYDESRRFFFFDDFFSFFFDDGTGVSSGFRFPATCTNAPDAGAAPAAVPKRFAFTSSIA